MEHHVSKLTEIVNHFLGGAVLALLNALGIHPHDEHLPIPEHVVMSGLVVLIGVVFVLWLRPRLSVERPCATQQCVEMLITNPTGFAIRDLLDSNVGHHGRKYLPMVGSITVFILMSNLISVLPSFTSPTGHPSVPLACALITFLHFNFAGIRANGLVGYLKHFAGPSPWIAPLLFPVEIASTSARIVSLTIRLWANMFSSELVYFTMLGMLMGATNHFWEQDAWWSYPVGGLFGLFALTVPVIFIVLHIFVALVQALVFTILPTVYLGLATAHEH